MNWNTKDNKRLFQAIVSLKNEKEARLFLRDLMTEKEIIEFANRLKAAKMLIDKIPYTAIEEKTGLSSRTIARISKFVFGKNKGYKLILNRMHHHNSTIMQREL